MSNTNQNLKIIPLGGLEEVGRNMTLFEYNNDILIVDAGLQFPDENMPGIDYIIPNISYLKGKEKNIVGIIITHGHYDHIGALPYIIDRLGCPPVYATKLTASIILKRQEDFKDLRKPQMNIIDKTDKLNLGAFKIEFFHVNHNIPGGVGLAINTPVGLVMHTGDFKFDHSPVADSPADISRISLLAKNGVLALMSDSTSVEQPGYSISEKTIEENLEPIFKQAVGRIIVSTFASLISRIQEVINLAEKYKRQVMIDGYSMKSNIAIARELGYLKIKPRTMVSIKEGVNLPPQKIVLICTGAQGEDNAVLMRIINREHKKIRIAKDDIVVFSSSVVPGNERSVQNLKDTLFHQGAKVFHYKMMDIHAGGHAQKEDLKMMINLVKPKFFIPIHGNYYMLKLHAELAEGVGILPKNIMVASNGTIITLNSQNIWRDQKQVPTSYVMVDGLGVGDVGEVVLRDRQTMAQDGMFVIIVTIDARQNKLYSSPDIISRGFIYMKDSKELVKQTREQIKKIVNSHLTAQSKVNEALLRDDLRDKIGAFLFQKTQRRPMVLPVVVGV